MTLELREVAERALKELTNIEEEQQGAINQQWQQFVAELGRREPLESIAQFPSLIADLRKWRLDALKSVHPGFLSSVDGILTAIRSSLSANREKLSSHLEDDSDSTRPRKRRKLEENQLDKDAENEHFAVPATTPRKKTKESSRPGGDEEMRFLRELNQIQRSDIQLNENDVLGRGAFATVCRGQFRGCPVAVKRVRPSVRDEDFYKEIRIISMLRHPNIVQYMAHFRTKTERCIVTEWAERGSLFNVLHSDEKASFVRSNNKRKLPWLLKVKMARDVAAALRFMHESNYRHCDINSKNLLVTREYRVKVADLGLSEEVQDDAASQLEDRRVGTLRWMSPEMLSKSCKSMEKSDVYSFGIVMFELGTERIPYFDKVDDEVRRLILKQVPPAVPDTSCWRECTRFRDLMNRCLHQQPNLRPDFPTIHTELLSIEKELVKENDKMDEAVALCRANEDLMGEENDEA